MRSRTKLVRRATVSLTTLLAVLLVAAVAQANPSRVTRGDAEAFAEASFGGGSVVRLNGGSVEGAPADSDAMARISPFSLWDGRHFCVLDWHVISLAVIDGNAAGESRTNAEIAEALVQNHIVFTLDGALLDSETSAVKRFLNPERLGVVEAFYIQEARVLAPEELSVGQHALAATISAPGVPPEDLDITFFIDAAGTGTCL